MQKYLESLHAICSRLHEEHPIGSLVATGIAITVPLLYYIYNRNLNHWTFKLDDWGSYELPGQKGVRCNKALPDGRLIDSLDNKFKPKGNGEVKTVYDCVLHGLSVSRDRPCLGRLVNDKYDWQTYADVVQSGRIVGHLLRDRGIKSQECVGIYAVNSPEWVHAQVACVLNNYITVPLYDTLGPESIRHTINEVELQVMFCDSEEKLKRIIQDRKNFPTLKLFIMTHDNMKDSKLVADCKAEGIELLYWSQAKAEGAKFNNLDDIKPKPDDLFLIQYTSGTTGVSKGVMLTHRNMVSCIAGAAGLCYLVEEKGEELLGDKDKMFFYLPLAHGYGQTALVWFLYAGGQVAFSSGNVAKIVQEMQLSQPTYLPLVPRIMNRVYTKVIDETKSGLKGWLFWKCYERKKALFKNGCLSRDTIYDFLVFRKLQKMIGGKVRFMTTGSAPIGVEVLEFWRVVFGAFIMEGYGQTENTSAATGAIDVVGGNVGHPILCNYIRLLDLPELGYTNKNNPPQGEICIKGPNVMKGYYKQPVLTKDAFTEDGWLMTGDIGEFLPDGSLRMIDRRKHIFKLAQGEYVAPEKIESVYAQCPLVAQVFVDGNSLQPYVIAVVVPDEKAAKDWAAANGLTGSSLDVICSNKGFQKYVLDALLALGKEKKLNSLEQIKSLYIHPEQFSVVNGLLTPSLKNKRNDLRKRFQSELEAVYKAGPLVASSRE